jgi:hypothetical protein
VESGLAVAAALAFEAGLASVGAAVWVAPGWTGFIGAAGLMFAGLCLVGAAVWAASAGAGDAAAVADPAGTGGAALAGLPQTSQ